MARIRPRYYYEAIDMVMYIMDGHNAQETADEFKVSRETVRRRLKIVGHTYLELVELRDKPKAR